MNAFSPSARTEWVTIETKSVTGDAAGQDVETWGTPVTEQASVRFGTGDERREAARLGESQAATFGFDWNSRTRAITASGHRLVYAGDSWDIRAVNTEPRNRGVVVTAVRSA